MEMQNNVPLELAKEPMTDAISPAPIAAPKIDLNDHRWYLNRELTWLAFKRSVLGQAGQRRRHDRPPGRTGQKRRLFRETGRV